MKHFIALESLRAYMAWWVVIGHALHLLGLAPSSYPEGFVNLCLRALTRGSTAVYVFVILSGFVIAHLLLARREAYVPYLFRRWMRLFPVFFVCILLALLVKPLYLEIYTGFTFAHGSEMREARAIAESSEFWSHALLHMSMLHGVVPHEVLPYASSTFLAPGWSLSLEWQFYLLAPLIIYFATRSLLCAFSLAFCLLAIRVVVEENSIFTWQYPSLLFLSIQYFLIGIASRIIIEVNLSRGRRIGWVLIMIVSALSADWLAVLIWMVAYVVVLGEAGYLTMGPRTASLATIVFHSRMISELGKWSYSTYLIHIPVFSVVVGGVSYLVVRELVYGELIFLTLLAVLLTIPISYYSYIVIERPFSKIGSRVASYLSSRKLPGTGDR